MVVFDDGSIKYQSISWLFSLQCIATDDDQQIIMILLNIQTSAGVPIDDLPILKIPLLPLDSIAVVHLHLRTLRWLESVL